MLGKCLTVGITLFWATMMTLLVEREILPAWRAEREAAHTPNYGQLEALAEKGQVRQMGIYRGDPPAGRRIGQTRSALRKDGAETLMTSDTRILLDLGKGETAFRFNFRASVIEGRLSRFDLRVFLTPADGQTAAPRSSAPLLHAGSSPPAPGRGGGGGGLEPSDSEAWAVVTGRPLGDALKLSIR